MPLAEDDQVVTIGSHGRRVWLYVDRVVGRWMVRRTAVAWLLFSILLVAPWIDMGDHAALRFDIPNRKFHLFGITLLASDSSYLLFLFGSVVFSVFLVTALWGRAWCGWACPQTVFLESIIRPIEALIEGSPRNRARLDQGPLTAAKAWKKGLKFAVYLVVAGAVGTTVVAYFIGREGVLDAQFDPRTHPAGTAFFVAITALLFFDFAWFREQTCVVVCPYGRFQSVLLDADSVSVNYDARRGEPRGKKGSTTGDCVDCHRCVQVCPTGIDIRKGVQMECVGCMACIDACDDVMVRMNRPEGLIRFASLNELEAKPRRVWRPRVVLYVIALVAVVAGLTFSLNHREALEFSLARAPGSLYTELPGDQVQNQANLRISNRSHTEREVRIEVVEPAGGSIVVPGQPLKMAAERELRVPVFMVRSRPETANGRSPFTIRVHDDQGYERLYTWNFMSKPR